MRKELVGRWVLVGCIGLASSALSWAQTVYRIVGADGRVTFSDKPPAQGEGKPQNLGRTPLPSTGPALPFELRQTVARFPVVLHSGNNCTPCTAGRALLGARGIPFTEKTVTTAEDSQALERLSGETVLPLLLIGSQQIKGFSATEWTQYLNAAGYPATSRLPAGFQQAAPLPLAEIPKTANSVNPVAANPAADSVSPPALPPLPASAPALPADIRANPAGIQF
jgi:hypothetical protein